MSNRLSIGIVGGGIAGLYCAWKLATEGHNRHSITLFECLNRFGGRIETLPLDDFKAECGPMRFELALQPLFRTLAKELGATFEKFSEPTGGTAEFPRYLLGDTEKSTAQLTAEEHAEKIRKGEVPQQQSQLTSSLDLLKLGVYRILNPKKREVSLPEVANYRILNREERQELLRSAGFGKGDPPENDEPPKWEPIEELKAAEKLGMPEEVIREKVRSGEILLYEDPDNVLQRFVYLKIPLIAEYANGFKSAADFNRLRSEEQLLEDKEQLLEDEKEEVRPLYTIGFWNALAHVLSPGAVGKIRDLATFYHLMPENPSAAEQTIFWLRLFRSDAHLSTIPEGVDIVVNNLVEKLSKFDERDVALLKNTTVTRISPGDMRGHKVRLSVESEELARNDFDFDHVIFALPQWPLRGLATAFPKPIQKHIEEVIAFPLLKVFVVVDNPWWNKKIRPQHGAHKVPTRELHYQCQDAKIGHNPVGMMMLYTDRPAARYWQPYVLKPHTQAQEKGPPALKNELAWQLLNALDRDDENNLKNLSAKALAETPLSESDASRLEDAKARDRLRELRERMQGPQAGLEEQIPNLPADKIHEIFEERTHGLTPRAQELIDKADEFKPDAIRDLAGTIKTFAIRDWAQPPFGAAAHVWAPGVDTQLALGKLKAFSLLGEEGVRNLHVCGEAYSDYQGFIEGALRSSEEVIKEIDPELGKP